jgi:hypothetical protein
LSPRPRPSPATSRQIDWMLHRETATCAGLPFLTSIVCKAAGHIGVASLQRSVMLVISPGTASCLLPRIPPPGSGSVPSIPGYLTLMPRADPEGATISSMSTPVACFLCQDHPWAQVHFLSSRSPPVSGGQSYIYTPAPPGIRPTLSIFISLSLN